MSFEPTIVILKKDFDKNKEIIVSGNWQYQGTKEKKDDEKTRGGEGNETIMEYIKYVYEKHNVVSIGGVKLILCNPTPSSFNKKIRKKLDDFNIEYGLSN